MTHIIMRSTLSSAFFIYYYYYCGIKLLKCDSPFLSNSRRSSEAITEQIHSWQVRIMAVWCHLWQEGEKKQETKAV